MCLNRGEWGEGEGGRRGEGEGVGVKKRIPRMEASSQAYTAHVYM